MKRLMTCLTFAAGAWLSAASAVAEVKEGQKAPDVELAVTQPGKDAKTIKLSGLMGKNVVVYFFPKAMTKG